MKEDPLPDEDHIVRYIGGSKLEDDIVSPTAFKDVNWEPSVNWLECCEGTKNEQLNRVRRLLRIKPGKTGRLAELKVNGIRNLPLSFDVVKDPLPADNEWPAVPCHALIKGIPTENSDLFYEALADQVSCLHKAIETRV